MVVITTRNNQVVNWKCNAPGTKLRVQGEKFGNALGSMCSKGWGNSLLSNLNRGPYGTRGNRSANPRRKIR